MVTVDGEGNRIMRIVLEVEAVIPHAPIEDMRHCKVPAVAHQLSRWDGDGVAVQGAFHPRVCAIGRDDVLDIDIAIVAEYDMHLTELLGEQPGVAVRVINQRISRAVIDFSLTLGGLDNHTIVIAHFPGTSRRPVVLQARTCGRMMGHTLDGRFLLVLHFGHRSGFLSLGFHYGVPLLVGRRRRRRRHIVLRGAGVNIL